MNFYIVFLAFFCSLIHAIPINLEKRDVFVPPVLQPSAGTVWKSGEVQEVTWDVSNPPAQITNKIGRIMLRKGDTTTPLVLAGNFDILSGSAKVEVPTVISGDDYGVVLFGDSGNFSPPFTIESEFKF